jgi:metal-responsive CopG/Arc/MetJ family transcriptional regulator
MKEKTSITLSKDILAGIDRLAGQTSRSAFIEHVLRQYLAEKKKAQIQARDLIRLNQASERLNEEAADVLEYQSSVD